MWDRFFDLDNVVWRTIDKIGKIFLLNLLWLICSLPVFTHANDAWWWALLQKKVSIFLKI